jgi:hypothetical protein
LGPAGDLVAWVAEQRARRAEQLTLRRLHRVVVLGQGPGAVTGGWSVGSDEWVRCVVCGYLLHLDGATTDQCWCRALTSDADAGRIGSDLGDDAVERVRLEPLEG